MGLYRATLNQPEARVGQTVELDDYDRDVRKRVLYGHLVPVDEIAKQAQEEVVTVDQEDVRTTKQKIQEALVAARAAANAVEDEKSTVSTALEAVAEEADTPDAETPEDVVTAGAPKYGTPTKKAHHSRPD